MKLPSLPFFKNAIPKEYFLALLLQDETVGAVVFEESEGTIHIIGEGKNTLQARIDDISFEELLASADKAISLAESSLPNNVQSHKTIFGVKEAWTQDLQIDKEHLGTLKKLCDELDLQPIGFLVFAEAIAHLLQKEEGAPVSGILIEVGAKYIAATLLRAGRVVLSKQATLTQNLPKTIENLLMEFTDVEILPSRIILLNNQKHAELVRHLTSYAWDKQLPFLHVPQVTALSEGFGTKAILFGTATQMGFEVLGLPQIKESHVPNESDEQLQTSASTFQQNSEQGESKETKVEDENVEEKLEEDPTQQSEPIEAPQSLGENFGFVKDKDVLETSPKAPIAFDNLHAPHGETEEEFADEVFAEIPQEVKEESLKSNLPGLGVSGVKITEGMQQVLKRVKKLPLASFLAPFKKVPSGIQDILDAGNGTKKIFFLAAIILIFIVCSLFWYIFGVKATATLLVHPKVVTASQGITFSSTNGTDVSSDTIGAAATPITETGTSSTQATGTQDVGDKAKGTVTIYNNDDASHTIPAGTTITCANGLTFTTNTDVSVASASGDIFSGTKPGTANVDVTASEIGTDYNIPSGTKFAIGSSTIIAAKNDSAFSGGTKKTVTVVSQKDLDKLTADLTNNLGQKAKQDAQNSTDSDKAVLGTFLDTTTSNQKFDHKVGDQASSITLAATITYQALSYSKSDVEKIALAIIKSNNQGENISQQNISEDIQNPTVSSDGKDISATLAIKAGLLPEIDTGKVVQKLAGKSFNQASVVLSDIPQLTGVHGVLSPNLFFLPKFFPKISSHITVIVSSDE